jgi:hypothetical protein
MADYSEQVRAQAARDGHALPDGSYPILNCQDLHDAADAYGRAPESHRAQLRALIRKENAERGCGVHLEKLEEP